MYFSSLGCDDGHENVTQVAENDGNSAVKGRKTRRKLVAGICPNLLIPFD